MITKSTYLLCISDLDEEGLQLQGLNKQSPADGLVVLRSQTWVCQSRCTQCHHLAERTHRPDYALPVLLFLYLLLLLFLSTVPLICCCVSGSAVAPSALVPCRHAFDEALQLWAELALLSVIQPPIQCSVDSHAEQVDQLEG